jgi:dihydroorotate dehydrogenase
MSHRLLRDLLFMLPPEVAHHVSLNALSLAERVGGLSLFAPTINNPKTVTVMGIEFPNQVGLAAGLDKNGEHINALSKLGFGFIEIGTVTPKPQKGNPKPRLFRLPEHEAVINRMGFNNVGVEQLLANVRRAKCSSVLGINIGKNASTQVENAIDDYMLGLSVVYQHAHYVTVNLSSPNTPGLRTLQFGDLFSALLEALKLQQQRLTKLHGKYVPIVIKIAPDLDEAELASIAKTLIQFEIDGVIATNTTVTRVGVESHNLAKEAGGLSGKPLFEKSTQVVAQLSAELGNKLPIIAAGGIMSGDDAASKISAGASLVQIYTGFIYKGSKLIGDSISTIANQDSSSK